MKLCRCLFGMYAPNIMPCIHLHNYPHAYIIPPVEKWKAAIFSPDALRIESNTVTLCNATDSVLIKKWTITTPPPSIFPICNSGKNKVSYAFIYQ